MRATTYLAVALSLAPAFANAQTTSAEPDTGDARARELYLRGDRLYAEGDYEEAIVLFRASHELSGRPGLLFNLANAYERAGHIEEAIAALREYAPHAPEYDHDTIARRIRALEERLVEGGPEGPASSGGSGDTPPPRYPADAQPPTTSSPSEGDGGGALVVGGTILLVVAAAAGAIGLGLAVATQDASAEAATLCNDGLCTDPARAVLNRESRLALGADISFAAGGALAIAGLVVLIVGATSGPSNDETVSVRPAVGLTFGGIDVSARF